MKVALNRVMVLTGSGISADSGIPTFRGPGGYWRNLDPQRMATHSAFNSNPALVWEWYVERREIIRRSLPNAAHTAVVELAEHSSDFLLVTQNVDDLHDRAEFNGRRLPAANIVHIHGDIFLTRCPRCGFHTQEQLKNSDPIPKCPNCGNTLRPGVIWFDEDLEPEQVSRIDAFLRRGPCNVVLVIGTTASFDYIVNWAVAAKGTTGALIEINTDQTPISPLATKVIRERAVVAVPALVRTLLDGNSRLACRTS